MLSPYISRPPVDDFGLTVSKLKFSALLTVNANQTLTVPGRAPRYKAVFHYEPNTQVWMALNEAAVLPTLATIDATGSELNPTCREVRAGDVLNFNAVDATAGLSIVLYALNSTS